MKELTEQELKSFIMKQFPRENESCEWKEFKNLKNSFCGKEKDDVVSYVSAISNMNGGALVLGVKDGSLDVVGIQEFGNYTECSAKLKLCEKCINLPSEGLTIESYVTSDTQKNVWVIETPKHSTRRPVYAHEKAWQRIGDSLVEMTGARLDSILSEIDIGYDWSKEIVSDATISDLSEEAIEKARKEYKKRNPKYSSEVDTWDDVTFLNKAKITLKGQITRTALILLGKEEAEHFISPGVMKIRWSLKNSRNENKDYEIFSMPMILAVEALLGKIRNVKYQSIRPGTLFPDEMMRYDPFSIREPLHNCIVHQDYTRGARIEVVEFEDSRIIFQNAGKFIPKSVETVVTDDCPESVYRNPFLAEAMRNLNMIETQGGGILKLFNQQRKRGFPMPEYNLSENKVKVVIEGNILDESFADILLKKNDLTLKEVLALDKVQKHKELSREEVRQLRMRGLVEGRRPHLYLSSSIVSASENRGLRTSYIHNRSFDDAHFKEMIVKYLEKFNEARRSDIEELIIPKLSAILTSTQKRDKVKNLLQALRRDGAILLKGRIWVANAEN